MWGLKNLPCCQDLTEPSLSSHDALVYVLVHFKDKHLVSHQVEEMWLGPSTATHQAIYIIRLAAPSNWLRCACDVMIGCAPHYQPYLEKHFAVKNIAWFIKYAVITNKVISGAADIRQQDLQRNVKLKHGFSKITRYCDVLVAIRFFLHDKIAIWYRFPWSCHSLSIASW